MAFGSLFAEAVSVFPFLITRPSEPGENEGEEELEYHVFKPFKFPDPQPKDSITAFHHTLRLHTILPTDSSQLPT